MRGHGLFWGRPLPELADALQAQVCGLPASDPEPYTLRPYPLLGLGRCVSRRVRSVRWCGALQHLQSMSLQPPCFLVAVISMIEEDALHVSHVCMALVTLLGNLSFSVRYKIAVAGLQPPVHPVTIQLSRMLCRSRPAEKV